MLRSYLAGANSRRIAAALKPLLGSTHLSKSAVSRVVGRLRQSFAKWRGLAPAVANSLEEAGEELLTFYRWPKSMWKSLRTTNPWENLNREFRRRTKTQGSFSTEDAALTLLYGLVALGHIKLRKVDGQQQLAEFVANAERSAA
jgi:transposase-like protein